MGFVLLLLIPLAMWFLVLRPQQARLRAQRDLVASLQAGDRVVTAGGIVGTLTVVGETEVTLSTGAGIELQVLRGAVSGRLDPPAPADDTVVDDPSDDTVVDDPDEQEG